MLKGFKGIQIEKSPEMTDGVRCDQLRLDKFY